MSQLDSHIEANTPAILEGIGANWTATKQWDLEYLSRKLGNDPVQVVTGDSERLYWNPRSGMDQERMPFVQFVQRLSQEKNETSRRFYLQDDINSFPTLKDDYELPPALALKPLRRTKFWISGRGMITPLHYDGVETLHWVVRGSKRFTCFAPGLSTFYPHPWFTTAPFISRVEADRPDYVRFPKFRRNAPLQIEIVAGEILYLPAFWWHQVLSISEINLSVNFVWFAKPAKNLRFLPQFARSVRHLFLRLREAQRKANDANLSNS